MQKLHPIESTQFNSETSTPSLSVLRLYFFIAAQITEVAQPMLLKWAGQID